MHSWLNNQNTFLIVQILSQPLSSISHPSPGETLLAICSFSFLVYRHTRTHTHTHPFLSFCLIHGSRWQRGVYQCCFSFRLFFLFVWMYNQLLFSAILLSAVSVTCDQLGFKYTIQKWEMGKFGIVSLSSLMKAGMILLWPAWNLIILLAHTTHAVYPAFFPSVVGICLCH